MHHHPASDDELPAISKWAGEAFNDYVLLPLAGELERHQLDSYSTGFDKSIRDFANSGFGSEIHFGPIDSFVNWIHPTPEPYKFKPSQPLVGVELNPGPPKGGLSKPLQPPTKQPQQAKAPVHTNQVRQSVEMKKPSIETPQSIAVAYSSGMKIGKPRIKRNSDDSVTISHTELVTLVSGTTNFTATSIAMQPGLGGTFTWLASQTAGWEKYKWDSLSAIYVTRTGSNTNGTVMLVPDYDAADPAPLNEVAAASYHGASDDVPWKNQIVHLDMKRSKELFLRNGPPGPNLDIKTYDFANLFVCTADGTAVNWGKVFIKYTVTLYNSQVITLPNTGGTATASAGLDATNTLVNATITPGSYITSVTTNNTLQLTNLIVGQKYMYVGGLTGTGISVINTPISGFNVSTNVQNDVGSGTGMFDMYILIATAPTATIGLTGTATTVTFAQTFFAPINSTTR